MECFALGPVFSPGGGKGMYRWVERLVTSVCDGVDGRKQQGRSECGVEMTRRSTER